MTFKDALGIFARTFAQLAAAALLAVQGYDWTTSDQIKNNGYLLGLALLAAVVGAIIAAGWAFVQSPATTPLGKATRTAVQTVLGGLTAVVFNTASDVVQFGHLLPPLLISAVLAFAVTLLSYVSPPVTQPTP